jgi:hypothetical protein
MISSKTDSLGGVVSPECPTQDVALDDRVSCAVERYFCRVMSVTDAGLSAVLQRLQLNNAFNSETLLPLSVKCAKMVQKTEYKSFTSAKNKERWET